MRFKVAIEALKERQTISELTAKFGVHATQITLWKKQLLEEGLEVFKEATKGEKDSWSVGSISRLANYRWNWTAAADRWLKKNLAYDTNQKRGFIETAHPSISIERQCELMGLARSSYYYESCPENEQNLALMRLLDKQYLDTPYYGIRGMRWFLQGLPSQSQKGGSLAALRSRVSETES